jgi:hypothetical protein
MRKRLLLTVTLTTLIALLLPWHAAGATFRGKNSGIAFSARRTGGDFDIVVAPTVPTRRC